MHADACQANSTEDINPGSIIAANSAADAQNKIVFRVFATPSFIHSHSSTTNNTPHDYRTPLHSTRPNPKDQHRTTNKETVGLSLGKH